MAGNYNNRIEQPLKIINGPLPGERLLESFKREMLGENVFRIMFGDDGQRIFIKDRPNLNETILPALILSWRSETYSSNNVYLDGVVDAIIVLPTKLIGDYGAQRRVASMIQRWMGGPMNLFIENPGLTKFGFGGDWTYTDMINQGGMDMPAITASFPFRFDLYQMQLQVEGFDPNRPLDDSDVGYLASIGISIKNQETGDTLLEVQIGEPQEEDGQ